MASCLYLERNKLSYLVAGGSFATWSKWHTEVRLLHSHRKLDVEMLPLIVTFKDKIKGKKKGKKKQTNKKQRDKSQGLQEDLGQIWQRPLKSLEGLCTFQREKKVHTSTSKVNTLMKKKKFLIFKRGVKSRIFNLSLVTSRLSDTDVYFLYSACITKGSGTLKLLNLLPC